MLSHAKNYFLNLNLFKSDNEQHQRSNLIATRIYILLMLIALLIIALVISLSQLTTTVKVEHPIKQQFEDFPFYAKCPCSRISIPYGEFLSINATFHQVCSSEFVSDRWLKTIYSGSNSTYFDRMDFRTSGSAIFQSIASFCRFSKDSIQQNSELLKSSQLISPSVLSETVLQSQVNAFINSFQMAIENTLTDQLALIREIMKANRLISGLKTNIEAAYIIQDTSNISMYIVPYSYVDINQTVCHCQSTLDCINTVGIYDIFNVSSLFDFSTRPPPLFTIPGFSSGCLPVTAMLFSTLQCFYNQTCLDELLTFIPTKENFTAMSTTNNSSQYNVNSSIQSLVERMMVEKWIINISHEKYYNQCAPLLCTYQKFVRRDFLFVISKVIGLIGGLTIVLSLIIPPPVRYIFNPRKNIQIQTSKMSST